MRSTTRRLRRAWRTGAVQARSSRPTGLPRAPQPRRRDRQSEGLGDGELAERFDELARATLPMGPLNRTNAHVARLSSGRHYPYTRHRAVETLLVHDLALVEAVMYAICLVHINA